MSEEQSKERVRHKKKIALKRKALKTGSFLNGDITQEKMSIKSIKCMTRNDVSNNKKLYSSYLNISNDLKLTNFLIKNQHLCMILFFAPRYLRLRKANFLRRDRQPWRISREE